MFLNEYHVDRFFALASYAFSMPAPCLIKLFVTVCSFLGVATYNGEYIGSKF